MGPIKTCFCPIFGLNLAVEQSIQQRKNSVEEHELILHNGKNTLDPLSLGDGILIWGVKSLDQKMIKREFTADGLLCSENEKRSSRTARVGVKRMEGKTEFAFLIVFFSLSSIVLGVCVWHLYLVKRATQIYLKLIPVAKNKRKKVLQMVLFWNVLLLM